MGALKYFCVHYIIAYMKNELNALPIPLLEWYHENARALPWRSDPTPYHVLVSEIMLQQTRVAAVLGYYARFLEALPTVSSLAAVEEDVLLKLWQGLGYYNRARNLQKAARQIMEDFGGEFPASYVNLLTLAGVGEYTAGAVASIAMGLPVPAVDGNVLRVVARIAGDGGDITKPDVKKRFTTALREVIPTAAPGDFNQALMELGATVCLPNGAPKCEACPAAHLCRAYQEGRTGELPVKAPKKARRAEGRIVYLILRDGKVAMRRRGRGLLEGLWEYPNTLAGEDPPMALTDLEFAAAGKHIFTHIEWHMTVFTAKAAEELPEGWVWADRAALRSEYAVPNAFRCCEPVLDRFL